ncbi:uncharacterized protein TNCV_3613241 [Trichonephila clavipes]|uniref:Uncharacterized protein n=1 Tax=Trichonephila clavipes TaxID=2585209 RepID=A0A8X6VP49_TRICX|nr:uncharacterized protein TNCV_3613241 [Trichonephila clavipes]
MQRDCALRIAGRGRLTTFSVEYKTGGVGTSGSERCHLHEDQAQDTLDRPVVEKTTTSSDDNRVCVWRPRDERLNPAFALQRHTAPTVGVMVLGCLCLQYTITSSIDLWHYDSLAIDLQTGRADLIESGRTIGLKESGCTMFNLRKQLLDTGSVERKPGQDRSKATTTIEERPLFMKAKRNRDVTPSHLSHELYAEPEFQG